jgi:hypothetical protein
MALSAYVDHTQQQQKRMEVLQRMMCYMDERMISAAHTSADRLLTILPHYPLGNNSVLVAFGGGKDSSYMVSFVRFIQLLIFQKHQETFHLRIATNRHAGMPASVMENIDRVYLNLGLYGDSSVELLLIDDREVSPFEVDHPLPRTVIERNRLDILMTGHRCGGEARPTFCNACNLSMVNSFAVAASYGDGIDIMVTGDSRRELLTYLAWLRRVAGRFGISQQRRGSDFHAFLQIVDDISQFYFSDIYGAEATTEIEGRRMPSQSIARETRLFSIYHDTDYEVANHWELLTNFLAFRFDEIAFSFTESDCSNPALMAHLRGLKAEKVYGRSYEEGICEYLQFALQLMRHKDFPDELIALMEQRYQTPEAIQAMRAKLDGYTQAILDLTEEQLVCMLYSPFVQHCAGLANYIGREQPELVPYLPGIHALLTEGSDTLQSCEERSLLTEHLERITHLEIERLRTLYTLNSALNSQNVVHTPISTILERDPHKAVIRTLHSPNGSPVDEIISGR